MKQNEIFTRNNLIVDELKKHRGKENAISSEYISRLCAENGYLIRPRNVGTVVNKLMMERSLPICYINGNGYYWANKSSEIEDTIKDLQSRIYALQEHINHLKCFVMEG